MTVVSGCWMRVVVRAVGVVGREGEMRRFELEKPPRELVRTPVDSAITTGLVREGPWVD